MPNTRGKNLMREPLPNKVKNIKSALVWYIDPLIDD